MKKPNIKVVITICIILVVFIVSIVIIAVNKSTVQNNTSSNTSESISTTSSDISTTSSDISTIDENSSENSNYSSSSSNDSSTTSTSTKEPDNSQTESTSSTNESIDESSDIIPDLIRPTIDFTLIDIDFAGESNLTAAQNTSATRIKFAQMIAKATAPKQIDYVDILDTSTPTRVIVDVHFENGSVVNYSVLFDNLNSYNFIRCGTTEEYEFIMNGGNL